MKEIFLHLGLHKTASGTLQRQFFPACPDLNLLTTLDPNVRTFIHAVTRQDTLYFNPEGARALIDRLLRVDVVNLLSNESLSGPPYAGVVEWGLDHRSPVLANLSAVFPEARAIIVLRRQDGLAKSLYRQYIKRGGTVGVRRFFGLDESRRQPLMSLDRFMFYPYIERLYEIFGSNVLVLTFEEFLKDQPTFLSRLCGFLGVNVPEIELRRENATRLGYFGMEITRLLNFLFKSLLNHGPLPGLPVRRDGQWRQISLIEYVHDYWPGRPDKDDRNALSRSANEILSLFKEDNRKLDRRFSLGLNRFEYY